MTQFNIEIVSDTICPWCYVGKKQLDRAIDAWKERYPKREDVFNIVWKPFYLVADLPKEAIEKSTYYNQRFGPSRASQIHASMTQIGLTHSISFKHGGKIGNTRDSHRLLQLAKTKSPATQSAVVLQLFKKYFEEEADITQLSVLKEAGVMGELDGDEVTEWIARGDNGGREVDREVDEAKRKGISGVPNFTVQGLYEVSGAQDSSVFLGIFGKIAGGAEVEKVGEGETC